MTDKLEFKDVPNPDSRIAIINTFALTFSIAEVDAEAFPRYDINSNLNALSTSDLRLILYCEQRRWNHFGREYDTETEKKVRYLVSIIRERLS